MPSPADSPLSRRRFLALGTAAAGTLSAGALSAAALVGCGASPSGAPRSGEAADSLLTARPVAAPAGSRPALLPGVAPLASDASPEMLLYVPTGYAPARAAPLLVMLHGAGGRNEGMIDLMRGHADALGTLLLAPQSVGTTWDFIWGRYGVDVRALDAALARVFRDCHVDPARVALGGFSDGASYALSLGLSNGDLFTRLVAFSPGILAPAAYRGRPRAFVSHGTQDRVLAIDRTSRRFVPELQGAGYDVTYREFDGPHAVPPAVALEGARFVAA
jgi:predicted esterase